jgi:hypothetical protein
MGLIRGEGAGRGRDTPPPPPPPPPPITGPGPTMVPRGACSMEEARCWAWRAAACLACITAVCTRVPPPGPVNNSQRDSSDSHDRHLERTRTADDGQRSHMRRGGEAALTVRCAQRGSTQASRQPRARGGVGVGGGSRARAEKGGGQVMHQSIAPGLRYLQALHYPTADAPGTWGTWVRGVPCGKQGWRWRTLQYHGRALHHWHLHRAHQGQRRERGRGVSSGS